jgi:hypothetical protein
MMMRFSFLTAALVCSALVPASAAQPGQVAITSAALKSTSVSGAIRTVNVAVTVTNHGSAKEPSNVLQSVVTVQDGTKTGTKGIPPLAPGASYTFVYSFQRAVGARPGSTRLTFRLMGDNAPGAAWVDSSSRVRLDA